MKLAAPFALCVLFATAPSLTPAQQTSAPRTQTQFTDPANLRGERIKPRDGRELPVDQGALGLQQLLRKLNTRASILNIVAHPDDEDGGMLTLYSRGLGARVADLALTRGEGGQNAMTGDFEDALGLLRTQELLANDRYTGVDQMFGTEVDFGFSKTKEEAFAKWTHDRVLYDAVRAIRLYRPLVITATFIGGVTDGHGQHQVSGQIAQEAFVAAADPKVFPDMIAEGIFPWQALRVYARVPFADINTKGVFDYATGQYVAPHFVNYVTGKVSTTKPPIDVIVPEGTPDPLFTAAAANPSDLPSDAPIAPLSYAQFSRIGLSLQRSQIGKDTRLPTAGIYDSGYTLYGSALCADHNPIKNCLADRSAKRAAEGPATTQVPRGFSLGSHNRSKEMGFSPEGMASSNEPNLFTGIDTSIEGIATLAPSAKGNIAIVIKSNFAGIEHSIAEASIDFKPNHPELAANRLSEALKLTDMTIDNIARFANQQLPLQEKANILHELRIKRVQLNDALVLALGLTLEATTDTAHDGDSVLYSPLEVHTKLTSGQPIDEGILYLQNGQGGWTNEHSNNPTPFTFTYPLPLAHTLDYADVNYSEIQHGPRAAITRPYFHRDSIEQPFYDLTAPHLRNAPATPNALNAWAEVRYQDVDLKLGRVVEDGGQPVHFIPKLNVALSLHAQVLPRSVLTFTVSATNHSLMDYPSYLGVCIADNCFDADKTPTLDPHRATITVTLPSAPPPSGLNLNGALLIDKGPGFDNRTNLDLQRDLEGYRPIGYGDLPRTNYYTPATTRIVPVDLKLPTHHNIAYLPGTGDAVPEALASINLTPTILTVADLTPTTLAQYDTVVLGVRTYNAHPDLHGAPTQALLDYARNGGNVVVQYQTPEFTAADAPYPLSLGSNEKVVDETAPVTLLSPDTLRFPDPSTSNLASPGTIRYPKPSGSALASPDTNRYPEPSGSGLIADKKGGALAPGYALLTAPNRITPADFNNWIEERGHGFLSTWDSHYTAPTETHDPGGPETRPQLPQRGGLITTPLGKGRWTYVAFALYRQLPEAVPGAFRLFVNLIAP